MYLAGDNLTDCHRKSILLAHVFIAREVGGVGGIGEEEG